MQCIYNTYKHGCLLYKVKLLDTATSPSIQYNNTMSILMLLAMFVQISSFLDIGYSFVTVVNAITRPANFDAYFGLNVAAADYVPVPYHVLNLIMWLFFLVMFPVVFRSLLVSQWGFQVSLGTLLLICTTPPRRSYFYVSKNLCWCMHGLCIM